MLFFRKKCRHEWEITEFIHEVVNVDTPYKWKRTTLHRICLRCLEKQEQYVHGHVEEEQLLKIFGGFDAP